MMLFVSFIALALGVAHPRLKSTISLGAGALLICVILLPLVDIIKGYEEKFNIDDYMNDIENSGSYDAVEIAFEEGIRQYIAENYGVSLASVTVTSDGFDLERIRAERIYVTLSGDAVKLDPKRLETKIAGEFTDGGECEVSIRLG